jgi:hypothetical protein
LFFKREDAGCCEVVILVGIVDAPKVVVAVPPVVAVFVEGGLDVVVVPVFPNKFNPPEGVVAVAAEGTVVVFDCVVVKGLFGLDAPKVKPLVELEVAEVVAGVLDAVDCRPDEKLGNALFAEVPPKDKTGVADWAAAELEVLPLEGLAANKVEVGVGAEVDCAPNSGLDPAGVVEVEAPNSGFGVEELLVFVDGVIVLASVDLDELGNGNIADVAVEARFDVALEVAGLERLKSPLPEPVDVNEAD